MAAQDGLTDSPSGKKTLPVRWSPGKKTPAPTSLSKTADDIRSLACQMCFEAQSGHLASSLSMVDILTTLFFSEMVWPAEAEKRDDFILSKGHGAPGLYAALIRKGILESSLIADLRKWGIPLQGHPDVRRLPEVEITSGALGQGLSMALGRAIAIRMKGQKRHVYCVIGDGESQEGQIWEAALFGGNQDLSHFVAFTDFNAAQSDGSLSDVLPLGELEKKWTAFGWFVQSVDGHDIEALRNAIARAKSKNDSRPNMILAHTQKGYVAKGFVVAEGDHSRILTAQDFDCVRRYLGAENSLQ